MNKIFLAGLLIFLIGVGLIILFYYCPENLPLFCSLVKSSLIPGTILLIFGLIVIIFSLIENQSDI